jgi:O-antigen/teichoic acid export membrane protein
MVSIARKDQLPNIKPPVQCGPDVTAVPGLILGGHFESPPAMVRLPADHSLIESSATPHERTRTMTSITTLFSRHGRPLTRHLTPTTWRIGLLFMVDMVTNLLDYGFHIYLGWVLSAGDFSIVQTMNALFLILVTTFGVLQPVVARYVASAGPDEAERDREQAVFQAYFSQGGLAGLALMALILIGREPLSVWLNVPVTVIAVAAFMAPLALLRPVVAGMLQGREQYVSFGTTRTVYAVGRLSLAVLFIGILGGGAAAGVAVMPLAAGLALILGLVLLGRMVWRRGQPLAGTQVWAGWRLSLAALLAYGGYMLALNADLIWVNRTFSEASAGAYAGAVVLRRVLAVLPGAVLVVFFPRVVARVSAGSIPDRLLIKTAAAVLSVNLILTTAYFFFGPQIVDLVFGGSFEEAGALLGLMGLAMVGYSLAAIWMNLFLATRPWPYVAMLIAITGLQLLALSLGRSTLAAVTGVFLVSGWLMAIGGLVLYLAWLRPRLATNAV